MVHSSSLVVWQTLGTEILESCGQTVVLDWTSSVCLAHLLGGGLALLLAAGRALLLHDRVVDRGALLLVHAVALLLVHSLALSVLHNGLNKT